MTQNCGRLRMRDATYTLILGTILIVTQASSRLEAAESETREYQVLVDSKPSGSARMVFESRNDGSVQVTSETNVTVKFLFLAYKYSFKGLEVWKDGRLQQFTSSCMDDGKQFEVQANADQNNLRIRVNNKERVVTGDVWLSSYWNQPDSKFVNQTVPVIDADTGKDLSARVQFLGAEKRTVAGQLQPVQHYRMAGKMPIDVWYDSTGRMVRQEWHEQGHRTTVELLRSEK